MKKNKLSIVCAMAIISILFSCGGNITSNTTDSSTSVEQNNSNTSTSSGELLTSTSENNAQTSSKEVNQTSSYVQLSNQMPDYSIVNKLKGYMASLLEYKSVNPYLYVPEAMIPNYINNFVETPISSYEADVRISDFNRQGYGEQWQMIVENLDQMITFTKALNVVESSITLVAEGMNSFIETVYEENLNYTLDRDSFKANLSLQNDFFLLTIDFKNEHNAPAFGKIKPSIKLGLDVNTMNRVVYISLNENNMFKYTILENKFELALTYGINLLNKTGSRTSYFVAQKESLATASGHIYEYTTLEGYDVVKACADFYITDDYVSVVGNKASGMILFSGYVNELYKVNDGRLLGYKVQEELSGVSYNTLWFNLWDINGINSVRVVEKTDANQSSKSIVDAYINGSSSLLVPTYNSKLGFKTSRKYDIELRKRYFYNQVEDKIKATEVEVPMMFIQDDNNIDKNYSDFPSDFKKDNNVNVSVSISSQVLTKIRSDYDLLIPVFKNNKEAMSSKLINEYLISFNNVR